MPGRAAISRAASPWGADITGLDFHDYDARGYRTLEVREGYDAWSRDYDRTADEELDHALLERVTGVEWRAVRCVADLGAGTGRTAAWIRERAMPGVVVDGVDLSPGMLEHAARRNAHRMLVRGDLVATPFRGGGYDLVISVLAACHLPRIDALYAEAARLAAPGGAFLLLDYHPGMLLSGIPTHFDAPGGEPIAIRNVIHLVSDHVNAGRAAGLDLVEMRERRVDQAWLARRPAMARHARHPLSMALLWRAAC